MRGAIAIGLSHESGLRLAIRVARDSMPPMRLAIIDDLAEHPYSTPDRRSQTVGKAAGHGRPTVTGAAQPARGGARRGNRRPADVVALHARRRHRPESPLSPRNINQRHMHTDGYLDSDKAGTNGAPRPRTGRNICEVCERALARTDPKALLVPEIPIKAHAVRRVRLHGLRHVLRGAVLR
jgi:hypothetical protein